MIYVQLPVKQEKHFSLSFHIFTNSIQPKEPIPVSFSSGRIKPAGLICQTGVSV